jgi:hypothetical protein
MAKAIGKTKRPARMRAFEFWLLDLGSNQGPTD